MKFKRLHRRRFLRWIAFLIAAAIILVYLVVPIGFGVSAILPYRETVGAPPAGFETVTLTTDDQVRLAAWYKPPLNDTVIILSHGAGGSREQMRSYAEMLARHDYGVLSLDLRGHGESAGHTNHFGWQGTRDVGAAVSFFAGT